MKEIKMAMNFSALRAKMPLIAEAHASELTKALLAEIPLKEFRQDESLPMILTLNIVKAEPCAYLARVEQVHDESVHASIQEAIQYYADDLGSAYPELRGFHVWYGAVCAGTIPISELRRDAAEIAKRLVTLVAVLKEGT